MLSRRPRSFLSALLVLSLLLAALGASKADTPPAQANQASTQAQTALKQGLSLLRRNRADQALPLFESALKEFTDAGDQVGAAATHDALGDVYLRQGQYELALPHYQTAADWYHAWNETANANLMYAKLGEAFYLAGREEDARAAFAKIIEQGKNRQGAGAIVETSGNGDGKHNNKGGAGGAVTFATISAALLPSLNCAAFKNPHNNQPSMPSLPPAGPPNMGHAPAGLDGIGRMDLRVTDDAGQPVQNVDAELATDRPNGFHCTCENVTDDTGRALMNPIHVGNVLKLKVKANGFEPQEITVDPQALSQPYHVTLHHKGGMMPLGSAAQNALKAAQPASMPDAPSPARTCFDFYALYTSYVTSELGLGRIAFEHDDLNTAQAHFANMLAASDGNAPTANLLAARLYRAVARTSLGDIALKQGQYTDAVKFYTQAAEGAQQDGRLELAWAAERGIGRARWLQASNAHDPRAMFQLRDEARKAYRTALDEIETLFAGSLRGDDARTSFLAHTKDVFDEAAAVSAEMALGAASGQMPVGNQALAHAPADVAAPLSGPALSYAIEAFRITEEGRARALLDLLSESHAEITQGVPAELLQRRADNLERQQQIAALLTGVSATNGVPDQSITKLEAELDRLSTEAESLENQLRAASPRYNTLVRTQPLTLADVQTQVLDNDTVLLEYSLGTEHSYLWTVTKNNGLWLYRLPARSVVEQQASALRDQLVPRGQRRAIAELTSDTQGGQTEDMRGLRLGGTPIAPETVRAYASAANALYQTVVAPAASVIAGKRLLVVADGALNFIPFEALVADSTGTDYSNLPYLVQTNEIVYAPSASVVAVIRQQKSGAGARGQSLLVIADPVFDPSDPRAKAAANMMRSGVGRLALSSAIGDVASLKLASLKLVRLAGTRTEAQEIAQLARTTGATADVWLDLEASEGNVETRDLSRYRVLHFATHGLLDTERPQFTGLALAPTGAPDADGFLRVGEVFNLRLGSPLVILSACETGLGKEKRGEGVIGLTRAFMYAGAPTVGVSLWSVADKSTAELMPDFYGRLLTGQASGAPAALRAAQQQMIAGKHYSAPFYWAPFVLVGDWR
jgi:CHAT domain-containing protein